MNWSIENLALAYELRQSGIAWKRIALRIGGDAKILKDRVRNLTINGIPRSLCKRKKGISTLSPAKSTE